MTDIFDLWYNAILVPWEGKISDRPPSVDPGGLTNRGVTIATWQKFAPLLFGIPGTESTLLKITPAQAKRIAKEVYWNYYSIDKLLNPAIQILVAESVWGGGGFTSLGYDQGTYPVRVAMINMDAAHNKNLFYTMLSRRRAYLQSLPHANDNPGWFTRTMGNDPYGRLGIKDLVETYGLNTIVSGAVAGGILMALAVFLIAKWVLKNMENKKLQ